LSPPGAWPRLTPRTLPLREDRLRGSSRGALAPPAPEHSGVAAGLTAAAGSACPTMLEGSETHRWVASDHGLARTAWRTGGETVDACRDVFDRHRVATWPKCYRRGLERPALLEWAGLLTEVCEAAANHRRSERSRLPGSDQTKSLIK